MHKFKAFVLSCLLLCGALSARECIPPLFSIGGGYYMAGSNHTDGVLQAEYKWGRKWLGFLRPQAVVLFPEFQAAFVGLGLGIELMASEHVLVIPSLTPGVYFRGGGRDLGYPLEFRSCIELAYQLRSEARLGVQFWHLSNCSLGDKNPGANAVALTLAIPL